MKQLKGFGLFWWDFLVGDAMELFFGSAIVLALALVAHNNRTLSVAIVLGGVIAILLVSTVRGGQVKK